MLFHSIDCSIHTLIYNNTRPVLLSVKVLHRAGEVLLHGAHSVISDVHVTHLLCA